MAIERILIVGLGSIGKRHLRLARELMPNSDIRCLRHKVSKEFCEYSNGSFSNIDEAITFAPQIAIIASPAPFHIKAAQALAEVGVHLFIEKPISASLVGVKQLLETCKKENLVLMVGYNLRFLPSLQRFRDMLHDGIVGKILSVRCEVGQYLPAWRSDKDYRQIVSARRELGGGALLELSHEIDYLLWIFGDVDWVKATLSRQSVLDIDVEDTAHLILAFSPTPDGRQLIGTLNLDFVRHDTTRSCIVIGEKGSLRWNGLTGEVFFYGVGRKEWELMFSHQHKRDESYLSEWQSFLECVNTKKTVVTTGEDGLKVMEIIEAIRHSALSFGAQVNNSSS